MFWPDYAAKSVIDIPPSFFKETGTVGLVADIDNTLALHNCPEPYQGVKEWIDSVKKAGVHFVLLSNNSPERTKPFADKLGVHYVAHASKPWGKGVGEAKKLAGGDHVLLIGDQVFTDVLAGKLWGMETVLVQPLDADFERFIIFKRYLEKIALLGFDRKRREIR